MHIALLAEKYPPDVGGLAVSAARLARLLACAGHTLQVLAPSVGLPPGVRVGQEQNGVAVERFGPFKRSDDTLALWFDILLERQRAAPFDLLHGYYLPQAGFLAAYAGRYLNIPAVASARGNDLDRAVFDPPKAAHIWYALQNAGAVTANTRDLLRKAQALAPGCRAQYVPNGVDAAFFCPQENPVQHLPAELHGLPVVGFVGEARAKKGLAVLLLAYRLLCRRTRAGLLLLGGVRPGDDQEMVRVFQKQNPSLPLCIVPPVPYEQLPDYYNLIDVLALPSLHDGLPNALLEGMACGRAVAAAPVGGMADVLADGANSLLVAPGDPEALADALDKLLAESELRRALGQQARQDVLAHFSLQRELDGYLNVYCQMGVGGSPL